MSRPTRSQAEKILAEVPFQDRLKAVRMSMPSGMHPADMRSLEEVGWFLEPMRRSLPGLKLEILAGWIETHLGDRETAEAIRKIEKNSPSLAEAYRQTWELVDARVREVREVLHG